MVKKGVPIHNTLTGEKVIFHKTLKEGDGHTVEFEQFLPPGRGQTAEHVHVDMFERFTIMSGTAVYSIEGVEGKAVAGDVVDIPIGVVHVNPRNISSDTLHMMRMVDPGFGIEAFYETIYGLASDGKTNANSFPNPLQLAVMFKAPGGATYFFPRQIPVWLQNPILNVLAIVGQLLGFKTTYPKYSSEGQAS